MANINEILARAAALRDETALNSISPERAGGIMYDTLLALNELWLQQGAALVISKIYASVAAMEADTAPVSDLTGKPLRPGQIVVIASSDSDNGSVYRYNGTESPSWSLVGSIGNLDPVDSLDSDSTTLPLAAHQGKVLDGKISQLGQKVTELDGDSLKMISEVGSRDLYSATTRQLTITSKYFKSGNHIIVTVVSNESTTSDLTLFVYNAEGTSYSNKGEKTGIGASWDFVLNSDSAKFVVYNNVDSSSDRGRFEIEVHYVGSYDIRDISEEVNNTTDVLTKSIYGLVERSRVLYDVRPTFDNVWAGNGETYIIPIKEGQRLDIVAGANETYAVFIANADTIKDGGSMNRVGQLSSIPANQTASLVAPSGSAYIAVSKKVYSNDNLVVSIKINGIELLGNVQDSLAQIGNILGLSTPVRKSATGRQLTFKDTIVKANNKVRITLESYGGTQTLQSLSIGVLCSRNDAGDSWYSIATITHYNESMDIVLPGDCNHLVFYNNSESYGYTISIHLLGMADDIKDLQKPKQYEIGIGGKHSLCIIDDSQNNFVGYDKVETKPVHKHTKNVVALNHDDFNLCDLNGTRRIYNKYGYTANFNFILMPFASKAEKEQKIQAAKKLIADGHKIGLHAYFASSFWFVNKLIDLKPDGTSSFAPTLEELKGNNPDGTGTNSFGDVITSSTKFGDIGFLDLPTSLVNKTVVSATEQDLQGIIGFYSVYANNSTMTGLDLDDNLVTKTYLGWAEYWYNNLISPSLGYSSSAETLSDRFAEDYSGTYPTANNILSGNYTNAGIFTKGLFKGAVTCCNYEVVDKIIRIAEAFCRHYYGLENFDCYGQHGQRFIKKYWVDSNGVKYDNREKTVVTDGNAKLYLTSGYYQWVSLLDILSWNGIKMINHDALLWSSVYGQDKLFIGQRDIVGPNFNHADIISYFSSISPSLSSPQGAVTYAQWRDSIAGIGNMIKWAYEKAGQDISGNGTMYMLPHIKEAIDLIRSCIGTGKIPSLSLDTVADYPSVMGAVEILCQYCYSNDIEIVGMEDARILANTERNACGNVIPNPSFTQSLLVNNFGGESNSNDAYLPDGWKGTTDGNSTYSVSAEQEGGAMQRIFTFGRESSANSISTTMYGLPAGRYKFSCKVKTSNSSLPPLKLVKRYNDEYKGATPRSVLVSASVSSSYVTVEQEFTIEAPYHTGQGNSIESILCNGYENNVKCIVLQLTSEAGATTRIYNPSLTLIG